MQGTSPRGQRMVHNTHEVLFVEESIWSNLQTAI